MNRNEVGITDKNAREFSFTGTNESDVDQYLRCTKEKPSVEFDEAA